MIKAAGEYPLFDAISQLKTGLPRGKSIAILPAGDSVSLSQNHPADHLKSRLLANISAATKAVFSGPVECKIRTSSGPHGVIEGSPFVKPDGNITFLEYRYALEINAGTLEVRNVKDIPYQESPDFRMTALSEDGVYYFVTQNGQFLRGLKDGEETMRIPVEKSCSTVAARYGNIAVGTESRDVRVYSPDGKLKWSSKLPEGVDKNDEWGRRPKRIFAAPGDVLYVKTYDDTFQRFTEKGVSWSYPEGFVRHDFEGLPPLSSPDGSALYVQVKDGLAALDEKTGKELWKIDMKADVAATPLLDEQGNLCVLNSRGKMMVISPGGEIKKSWSTGSSPSITNSARPQIAFDGNGNLCVMADQLMFKVFTREGESLLEVNCAKIFWDRAYYQEFILTEGGKKAIIIGGSRDIGEVELPLSKAQQAERLLQEQKEIPLEESESLDCGDYILIDGIKLPKQRHLSFFSLTA